MPEGVVQASGQVHSSSYLGNIDLILQWLALETIRRTRRNRLPLAGAVAALPAYLSYAN